MQGWSNTIRTGSPEADLQSVDQHRAQAAQQGLVLHVQPLPQGGFFVQALPPGVPPGQGGAPAPDPAAQFSGTMPSPQRAPTPAPMPMPSPGPTPAPDPAAQFGGTMPSPFAGHAPRFAPAPQVELHPSARYEGLGTCQACGRHAATKNLTFMQNIGALVIRFPKTVSGHICKFCVEKFFFQYTAVTLFLGWWGVISFVYTCIALPVNVVNRVRAIGLEPPAEDALSVGDRRSRGLWQIVIGLVVGVLSAINLFATVAMLAEGEDLGDVLLVFFVALFTVHVPALLFLIFGIRNRVLASRAARQLGIA